MLYLFQEDHEAEFVKLESVENHIRSFESVSVAKSKLNLKRNRYKEMVPYDSNIVYLDPSLGNSPSPYINASRVTFQQNYIKKYELFKINFPHLDENIIAAQAPKKSMFAGFWQLVWEQDVGVIGK